MADRSSKPGWAIPQPSRITSSTFLFILYFGERFANFLKVGKSSKIQKYKKQKVIIHQKSHTFQYGFFDCKKWIRDKMYQIDTV
jgi:hypothetical protein